MMALSQQRTKRLLSIHGWSGTVLGLLLYVVIVTGAVAVLAPEIGRWSAGGVSSESPLGPGLNDRVVALSQTVDPKYTDDVAIYGNSAGNTIVFFHTHGTNATGAPDDLGVMIEFHPETGDEVLRREGYGIELFGTDPASALDHFIVDLHVNLHLPAPWGLYATGILGLMMFVAAGTGLLIHRHLLKDIFVAPRYSSALLHKRDRHILAGSWSLVFAFVLAFSGSFLSFAGALGLPIVATTAFGGDQIAMFSALVGEEAATDDTAAKLHDLDAIAEDATARANSKPTFISISHAGRADAAVTLTHNPKPGHIDLQNFVYSGVDGSFRKTKPSLGTVPSAGDTGFNLMVALHYGNFAGLLSKYIWVSLGFAMAFVTLSGMRLWVQRRSVSKLWRSFSAAISTIGYGLPIALTAAAYGFFAGVPANVMQVSTTAGFLIGCSVPILLGCRHRGESPNVLTRRLQTLLGCLLLILPIVRVVSVGDAMGALSQFDPIVVMVDLTLYLSGMCCLAPRIVRGWRSNKRFKSALPVVD